MYYELLCTATLCTKGSKLFETYDVEMYVELTKAYERMTPEEKSKYKGSSDYIEKSGGPKLSPLNMCYRKLSSEIEFRLTSSAIPEVLPIDVVLHDKSTIDLLNSLETVEYIKEIYRQKKANVQDGLNTSNSMVLLECMRQGRSLLQAGQKAEILAKPLIDFYAASAYAYAIIVTNSPLHKSIDSLKGSHGHNYDHKNGTVNFGGDIPTGTFLDLMFAVPVSQVHHNNLDIKFSLLPSLEFIQSHSISISLLSLLSMVPELQSYYDKVNPNSRVVHKISIDTGIINSKITYNFYIGDGIKKPDIVKLKSCFKTEDIIENQGSYKVTVDSDSLSHISPTIYQDTRGDLWYVESPVDGLVIPELCLHFLIISALCNIMRYSPHEWNIILTNNISQPFSLLINRYIGLFEIKFPMIATQYLTNYNPIIQW